MRYDIFLFYLYLYAEFIPATHQYLLTILAIWWAWGQLLTSLVGRTQIYHKRRLDVTFSKIAWALIPNFSCSSSSSCAKADNMGWRYLLFTLGGLMMFFWILRFFVFNLYESPRYLVARGMDKQAVEVLHKVAAFNRTTCSLTVDHLSAVAVEKEEPVTTSPLGFAAIANQSLNRIVYHVKALFSTRKMAWSTSLLISIWGKRNLVLTMSPFPS